MTLYPIITTPALKECSDFYKRAFDASVLFESEWYVHLRVGQWEVGFLRPNPPKRMPVFQHATLSKGVCFGLEVEDIASVYEQLKSRGFDPLTKPEQFPSGDISFTVVDPAGVVINVVEHLPEKSGVIEL